MEDKEYRVVWQGEGSSLAPLPIGETVTTLADAKWIAKGRHANELRAERCRVWIEYRPIGVWRPCLL